MDGFQSLKKTLIIGREKGKEKKKKIDFIQGTLRALHVPQDVSSPGKGEGPTFCEERGGGQHTSEGLKDRQLNRDDILRMQPKLGQHHSIQHARETVWHRHKRGKKVRDVNFPSHEGRIGVKVALRSMGRGKNPGSEIFKTSDGFFLKDHKGINKRVTVVDCSYLRAWLYHWEGKRSEDPGGKG